MPGTSLTVADYIVAVLVLLIPLGIGVVFAVKDAKKMTRNEYLLGGQRMTMLPVALSMFATFQSGISLTGIPSEVYLYGTGVFFYFVGFAVSFIVCYFTFIPLMYPLEVTSVYEYLNLRFRSQAVRMLSSLVGCLQTIFFMAIALLAPALALQAVNDMPLWMSVILVGLIGTVYTVVGGIKSVIWADAFQTAVMFIGVFAMLIKGSMIVGGISKVWSISDEGGRVLFNKYIPDPRIRLTWLGTLLGGFVSWVSTSYTQSSLQRVRSMKNLRSAKRSYLVNIPLILLYGFLLTLVGITSYAYFSHMRCDPLKSHLIRNPNQISAYFVLQAMSDLPGMSGLYVATLLSGTLSTFSSGINALAANTVEDILERPLKNVSEKTAILVTKIAVALYGILVCILALGAQYLRGPVSQMVASITAPLSTITTGMFLIGCTIPWANKYGALAGGIVSFIMMSWLIIGSILHGRRPPRLAPAPTDGCVANSTLIGKPVGVANASLAFLNSSCTPHDDIISSTHDLADDPLSHAFSMYDISYEWYSVVAIVITIVVGLVVSYATKRISQTMSSADSKLLFSICQRFISHDELQTVENREMLVSHKGESALA